VLTTESPDVFEYLSDTLKEKYLGLGGFLLCKENYFVDPTIKQPLSSSVLNVAYLRSGSGSFVFGFCSFSPQNK